MKNSICTIFALVISINHVSGQKPIYNRLLNLKTGYTIEQLKLKNAIQNINDTSALISKYASVFHSSFSFLIR